MILFAIGNVLRKVNRHMLASTIRCITTGYKTHWGIGCQLTAAAASLRRLLVQNEISGRGVNSKKEIQHRHNI